MKLLKCFAVILILISLNPTKTKSQVYCNVSDSLALIDLAFELQLDLLPVQAWGPGSGTPPSDWFGIDTFHSSPTEYRIRKIIVTNQIIVSGTLPDTLFNNDRLNKLDTLILSGNDAIYFGDTLRKTAGLPAPSLKYVDISWMDLPDIGTEFLQVLLHNMSNLNTLKMDNCILPDPLKLYTLPVTSSLVRLIMTDCTLPADTVFLDTLLNSLGSLQELYIENTSTTAIISSAAIPGSLQRLYIEGNNIQDFKDIGSLLKNLSNLQKLYAQDAMDSLVTDSIELDVTSVMTNLITLDLSENRLYGPVPLQLFERFSNLQYLYLNNNQIYGKLPLPVSFVAIGPMSGFPAYRGTKFLREFDISNNLIRGMLHLEWLFGFQLSNFGPGGSNMPLEYFNVSNNKFGGVRPLLNNNTANVIIGSLIPQRFPVLSELVVHDNYFGFIDLFRFLKIFRLKQVTPIIASHYIPQSGLDTTSFNYSPQADLGIGGVRRRNPAKRISIAAGSGLESAEQSITNFLGNKYRWERRDTASLAGGTATNPLTQFLGQNQQSGGSTSSNIITNNVGGIAQSDPSFLVGVDSSSANAHILGVDNLDSASHHNWLFRAQVTNDSFPMLTLNSVFKKVEVGKCVDGSGAPVHCQSMIVQFDPALLATMTIAEQDSMKEAVKEELGAIPLEQCLCGDIELWGISDTATSMLEGFGSGTRQSTTKTSSKPQLLSSDPNYSLLAGTANSLPDSVVLPANAGNTSAKTLVAIIDSGLDYEYTGLTPYLSEGASTASTCLPNAVWGYNFVDDNNNASDDHGHGTAVAGVVAGISQQSILPDTGSMKTDIGILPLKYTDKAGNGSLFHAACAVRYAADYERSIAGGTAKVKVINASWGYYGDPCMLLENQIAYVGNDCGVLLVASAGNDGSIVEGADSLRHWPSNSIWDTTGTLGIDNVIAVAGVDQSLNSLDVNSNYGSIHIDIAAPWNEVSTQAGSVNGFVNVQGTSFAAPQISRAAALLFDKYPDATYYAVKYALMEGVDKLQSADSLKILSGGRVNYQKADSIMAIIMDRTLCSPNMTVDVNEIEDIDQYIRVYPNPVTENLTIDISYSINSEDIELSLYTISGQIIRQVELNAGASETTLSTNDLPAGVYFLNILVSGKPFSKKIIKL
jgi:subtilisin family serine protease/Leucine-rich repeat (LRR) protein